MTVEPNSASRFRLAVVGAIVFAANCGLLVLQLVAGKLLSPFVGSSLETWTAVIGVFLAGIAVGNAVGGRLAHRASPRLLAVILLAGAVAALWMIALPAILQTTQIHRLLELNPRIPVVTFLLCFPAGFVLSLLTAPAIELGLADIRRAGRVAGLIFSLSTLGCLVGNYVTGFVLIPSFTIDLIVVATAAGLAATAVAACFVPRRTEPTADGSIAAIVVNPDPLPFRRAAAIVFLCSFAGMTLELTASRIIAQNLGVSLFTWTGIIGVMLAGTALGNWLGGRLADGAPPGEGRNRLGLYLLYAGYGIGLVLVVYGVVLNVPWFRDSILDAGPIARVVLWTFALFFLPMLALGTISPQVIRLTIPSSDRAGRTAGRVYAWSTAGAIAGTFATGYFLISGLGMFRTILTAALLPVLALLLLRVALKQNLLLYGLSILVGGVVTGLVRFDNAGAGVALETNYYTIRIVDTDIYDHDRVIHAKQMQLDYLIHSTVVLDDPTYLFYPHEQIQMEFLRAVPTRNPRVLVIGGGGYTYPRCASVEVPSVQLDVVEIDPGVTEVAYSHLGLDPALPIRSFNQDGRQFVEERAEVGVYDLVTLDAVNDLSVPGHLLTAEFNVGVKKTLKPNGVYLVTVIDILQYGRLWKAVSHTLKENFKHVELLTYDDDYDAQQQKVYCLYASDMPLNLEKLEKSQGGKPLYARRLPDGEEARMLRLERIVLRDQFAPTDNMMSGVFVRRARRK